MPIAPSASMHIMHHCSEYNLFYFSEDKGHITTKLLTLSRRTTTLQAVSRVHTLP
jgi:hypothetical protein